MGVGSEYRPTPCSLTRRLEHEIFDFLTFFELSALTKLLASRVLVFSLGSIPTEHYPKTGGFEGSANAHHAALCSQTDSVQCPTRLYCITSGSPM
jgi:hypothetical protein